MSVSVIRYSAVCLMAGSFLSSFAYADYNCTKSPDCASLGYTVDEADCDEGIKVLCPTDTSKAFCKANPCSSLTAAIDSCPTNASCQTFADCSSKIQSWDCNSGYEKSGNECILALKAGSILYGDGSTSSKLVSGKTPIGVVFDVGNRLAVALTDVNSSGSAGSSTMRWSSEHCSVPGLRDCPYSNNDTSVDSCGVDGRDNTKAILATNGGCSGTTYAANGANLYTPSGCSKAFCQKGQWFLPSMRDLAKIYANKSVINANLSLLNSFGAKTLTESYWSSTLYAHHSAWGFGMTSGYRDWYTKSGYSHYVRPVLAFY